MEVSWLTHPDGAQDKRKYLAPVVAIGVGPLASVETMKIAPFKQTVKRTLPNPRYKPFNASISA
jgi:hypothetical protein